MMNRATDTQTTFNKNSTFYLGSPKIDSKAFQLNLESTPSANLFFKNFSVNNPSTKMMFDTPTIQQGLAHSLET